MMENPWWWDLRPTEYSAVLKAFTAMERLDVGVEGFLELAKHLENLHDKETNV